MTTRISILQMVTDLPLELQDIIWDNWRKQCMYYITDKNIKAKMIDLWGLDKKYSLCCDSHFTLLRFARFFNFLRLSDGLAELQYSS